MTLFGIKWQRHELWTLLAISLLSVSLTLVRLDETPIGAVTDDAYYIEMARSIAYGLGPVLNIGPDTPAANPGIFPPGFPIALSPLALWFPDSLTVLKTVPLLATLLLVPLCLWLPGPQADNRLRLALTAVVMLNPWVIAWSGRILSDNPYTALSLGALLVFAHFPPTKITPRGVILLGIVLTTAAVSMRTIGWAAVFAITAFLISRRRWLWAVALPLTVAGLTCFAPGKALLTPAYTAQMFHHHHLTRFILQNLLEYVAELPVILVPILGAPVAPVFTRLGAGILYPATAFLTGTLLLLLMGRAVITRWRDKQTGPAVRLFTFYLVFYAGALAQFDGYPSGVQTRLLIPVLPIMAWLVLLGINDIAGGTRRVLPRMILAVMILAALIHNGWRVARPLRTAVEANGHGLVDPGRGMAWLNTQVPTVTMAEEPLQRHIYLQRPIVGFPAEISSATVVCRIADYGVTHILIGPSVHGAPHRLDDAGRNMLTILQKQPQLFALSHEDQADSLFIFESLCP